MGAIALPKRKKEIRILDMKKGCQLLALDPILGKMHHCGSA
jgi:hypothetical protein